MLCLWCWSPNIKGWLVHYSGIFHQTPIVNREHHLRQTHKHTLEQRFSKWATRPLRQPHQPSMLLQEDNGKLEGHCNFFFLVGHLNFSVWINYFKFKIESKVPFSPASPAACRRSYILLLFPLLVWLNMVAVGWFVQSKVRNSLRVVKRDDLAGHWPHCNRAFKNLQMFTRPKEYTINHNTNY